MTLEYNKDGKLEFDLHSLLSCIKDESKIELIESLSCDDAIIKHVTDQILDGRTENMFCGASVYEQSDTTYYALDKARREISKRSSELAEQTIEGLEKTIARQKQELEEYRQKEYERCSRRIY